MPSPSQNFTRRVYHGTGDDPYGDDPPAAALEALSVLTGSVALFILLGALAGPGMLGLAAAQLAGLAAVPIAWAIMRGQPGARLGLGAPPVRAVVGAILVGATLWWINARLAEPIVRVVGPDEIQRLDRTFTAPPFAITLLVVALLPAICEELLMRGVVARALRPVAGRVIAVVGSAIAFAAFHLSVVRFVPTLILGLALGAITIAADSVWPAVLAHLLNNALALAVAGGALAPLGAIVSAHPDLTLLGSIVISATGLVISLAPRHPM